WTTLSNDITNADTSVTVADATAITKNSLIRIDTENMTVTAKAGNTLTVTRASNGTTAAPHLTGAGVTSAFDQRSFGRVLDGPDANTTATIDIGAVEASYLIATNAGTP